MQQKTVTREEILEKTGIPSGSFRHWCGEAGVRPIGKPYQKPGCNFLMLDYPADAIPKIKKVFDESRARREGRL